MEGGWSLNLRRSSHVLKRISTPLGNSRCVAVEKSNNLRVQLEKRVNNAEDFEIKKHVFAKGKSRADFTF